MKFIDEAKIEVHAGKGGAGSRHFRRVKYNPLGGPDGGNGGRGGSVILVADKNKHTLLDFRFQPKWRAEDGEAGEGAGKDGKAGEDLTVNVPLGTQVLRDDGKLLHDLDEDGKAVVLCRGGRGGKGNTFFKSSTNRAPEYAQPGEPGNSGTFIFSLKLLADVGLLGFPNAGKSSLVARISAAKPKVADYPFTTLEPNLGVVQSKRGPFVIADVPGLIEGASQGKGLGVRFLKHMERTKIIAHCIDSLPMIEAEDIAPTLQAFDTLNHELAEYSEELTAAPQVIVLTKADLGVPAELFESLREEFKRRGRECLLVSSTSGQGIEELVDVLSRYVYEQTSDPE